MPYQWKPYVSAAERRRMAERMAAKFEKKGQALSPVRIAGLAIAQTFWGKAWCDNLERYSDYDNRLPRGRTYVRNGSVIDLKISAGAVTAQVMGSDLYRVQVKVATVPRAHWSAVCKDCTGAIDSLVELLQGRFSKGVMERICRHGSGLFPAKKEITFDCSCPDWASMCKHVAAVLYGIGARLDQQPELLFELRKVDHKDLIASAGTDLTLGGQGAAPAKVLGGSGLAEIFGIEMAQTAALTLAPARKPTRKRAKSSAKPTRKRATARKRSGKVIPPDPAQRRRK